jgi:hypothetical protein
VLKRELFRAAIGSLDIERGVAGERRLALDVVDLALFGQLAESAGQLLHDAVLEPAQLVQIDLRIGIRDAPRRRVLRLGNQFGDVQQGLRRDAAAIQAYAAGIRLGVDQGHLHAHVRRRKRGRVSARPPANHH